MTLEASDLVDALAVVDRGDAAAWARLVAVAGPALARTCVRVAGRDLADDALHDCLVLVRTRAGSAKPVDEAAAMAWLQRVATTSALQALRRRRRQRRLAAEFALVPRDAVADAHADLEVRERDEALRRELASLPRDQREAVAMHHLAGEPVLVVAAAQGVTVEAAKKRIQRGVATLRARLARHGLPFAPGALAAALVEAADAEEPAAAAALDHAIAAGITPPSTSTGVFPMATALCAPVAALALLIWSSSGVPETVDIAVGDRPPAVPILHRDGSPIAGGTNGDEAPVPEWRAELDRALLRPIDVGFDGVALLDALTRLHEVSGLVTVVDPRVLAAPPGPLTMRARQRTAREALLEIARLSGLRCAIVDGAVLLARPEAFAVDAPVRAAARETLAVGDAAHIAAALGRIIGHAEAAAVPPEQRVALLRMLVEEHEMLDAPVTEDAVRR